jgi:hypothetical protein
MERHEAIITDLVTRARKGDKPAWDALVERYASLIWSICRRYELRGADAEDVGQSVWLHLVDHLDRVRDPAALPGWLATTARRECARVGKDASQPQTPGCGSPGAYCGQSALVGAGKGRRGLGGLCPTCPRR